ncbi:MAG: hypothetical protein H0W76_06570 [Pyrinomonadaceae bacterium]|nr:hypothetical protein [Pyrinomonadaceae bacterium]
MAYVTPDGFPTRQRYATPNQRSTRAIAIAQPANVINLLMTWQQLTSARQLSRCANVAARA